MRFSVAIACSLACAAALLLAACPRQYQAGQRPQQQFGAATHPWELQDWRMPLAPRSEGGTAAAEVELPPDIGPQLPKQDQLDPAQLPGIWLQVCSASMERLNLVLPEDMDELEFRDGGQLEYRDIKDARAAIYSGTWEKTKPGRLRLILPGATDTETYAVMFRGEFLYIWDQQKSKADWYARVPLLPTERIMANSFDTSGGRMTLSKVVGSSFEGTVESPDSSMRIAGFYQSGIISMRWEDQGHKAEGYAVFHVDKEWNSLFGAAWLDDFKGSPFAGAWDGIRAQDQPVAGTPTQ